ncbi:MAG: S1 RNA-binding domain-containing protein, partial [Chloroflexota bacterium]
MSFFGNDNHLEQPLDDDTFMALIEAYDYPAPRRGDILEGEILRINQNELLLDVGSKRTATVPYQELKDLEIIDDLSVGDEIKVYVTETPGEENDLVVSVEKILVERDWERAAEAFKNDEILELEIVGHNRGGLIIEFGRIRGFIPHSHYPALRHIGDPRKKQAAKEKLIGTRADLKIIQVDQDQEKLVFSAKSTQKGLDEEAFNALEIGQVLTGTVTSIKPYGVFVDIGSFTGLLHITNIAHTEVKYPGDILSIGEHVKVMIEGIDKKKRRISLSR